MKLLLDTINKIIEIDGEVNYKEFVDFMENTLKDFKEYKIKSKDNTIYNYNPYSPILSPTIQPYYNDMFKVYNSGCITVSDGNITTSTAHIN